MYLKVHGRIYNLASWSMISRAVEEGSYRAAQGGADRGAAQITLPGISLTVSFSDTTAENPVSDEALVELIGNSSAREVGVVTWDEFEMMYRETALKMELRRKLREAMKA